MAVKAQKPCIGFDFGGAYFKLAVVDKTGVSQLLVEPLPEGLVKEGEIIALGPMLAFVRETLQKHRIRAKDCAFILPPKTFMFRNISTPVMDDRQIMANLPFEFQELISDSSVKHYYDYAIAGLQKNEADEVTGLELMAVAVARSVVDDYAHFFKKAGLKLCMAAPMECAFSNMIRYFENNNPEVEEGQGYCLLDIGHEATRLHMYTGPLYEASRVIEGGAALLDVAIARDLNLTIEEARSYKESSQEATRHLREASSAYSNIALEIRKAINFYNSSTKGKAVERIYCFGGGARMTPLIDTLKETVGLELHDAAQLLPPVRGSFEDANLCVTAIGITLQ